MDNISTRYRVQIPAVSTKPLSVLVLLVYQGCIDLTSSDKSIVAGFVSELSKKAEYGIRGEKPLAVIAALKYIQENNISGKKLLELLAEPHAKVIRSIFLDLTKEYSSIKEPNTSWEIIAGKKRELQEAVLQFHAGNVNEAFSKLKTEETESLLKSYLNYMTLKKR
jgi:hypothetical protein